MAYKAVFLGSKALGLGILRILHGTNDTVRWMCIHPNDFEDARCAYDEFNDFARQYDLDILVASSPYAAREILRYGEFDIAFVCGWYWPILLQKSVGSLVSAGAYSQKNRARSRPPQALNGPSDLGTHA